MFVGGALINALALKSARVGKNGAASAPSKLFPAKEDVGGGGGWGGLGPPSKNLLLLTSLEVYHQDRTNYPIIIINIIINICTRSFSAKFIGSDLIKSLSVCFFLDLFLLINYLLSDFQHQMLKYLQKQAQVGSVFSKYFY